MLLMNDWQRIVCDITALSACLRLQDHIIELGKLALDCILISEFDLGRVCHCLGKSIG